MRIQRVLLAPLLAAIALPASAPCQTGQTAKARDLGEAKAEAMGFSAQRLERLHAALRQRVDSKQLPNVVPLLAPQGKIIDSEVYGKRDLASGAAVDKDTIFRIYSMTKPVT